MYNSEITTRTFDMNLERDTREYDVILNDPLCTLLEEKYEKVTEREMGDEGRIMSIQERLVKVVTYKRKRLL
jgi:hypothetical protein